jgi:hypothetical protein
LALSSPSTAPASAESTVPGASPNPLPYYLLGTALATLGVASGVGATAFYLKREAQARAWNSSACERPGSTREQQCAAVDDRRQRDEHWAVGLAASSGALLLGGLVSLLITPPRRQPPVVALVVSPRQLGLSVSSSL